MYESLLLLEELANSPLEHEYEDGELMIEAMFVDGPVDVVIEGAVVSVADPAQARQLLNESVLNNRRAYIQTQAVDLIDEQMWALVNGGAPLSSAQIERYRRKAVIAQQVVDGVANSHGPIESEDHAHSVLAKALAYDAILDASEQGREKINAKINALQGDELEAFALAIPDLIKQSAADAIAKQMPTNSEDTAATADLVTE